MSMRFITAALMPLSQALNWACCQLDLWPLLDLNLTFAPLNSYCRSSNRLLCNMTVQACSMPFLGSQACPELMQHVAALL